MERQCCQQSRGVSREAWGTRKRKTDGSETEDKRKWRKRNGSKIILLDGKLGRPQGEGGPPSPPPKPKRLLEKNGVIFQSCIK